MTEEFSWMIGRLLGGVERDASGGPWWFRLGDGFSLLLHGHWQILAEGRVALASGDHGQPYGLPAPIDAPAEAARLLGGRPVRSVVLARGSSELEVQFEGGVGLRTFNDSSGYEGWRLRGPGRREWVCQGGGTICRVVADGDSRSRRETVGE